MRALTLWQPWAHAICYLGKRIENRSWHPPGRQIGQDLAIHAGKRLDRDAVDEIEYYFADMQDSPPMVFGAVVAVARLRGFARTAEEIRRHGVDVDGRAWWSGPGHVAWILDDIRVLDRPIQCRGRQGLWTLDEKIASQVSDLLFHAT